MIINQSKLIISREDIKNLEHPNLKDIQLLEIKEIPTQNYYQSIIAIIERLLCS
ncbi:MAG: hypothetical protein PWP62_2389 [Eubacteriaceae bacterium]|nr:hypothetical protein [Eubacteriaceae bacterium]MDK2961217.1 hypothetical protein [Eubacteriaceae bacterium]